VDKSKLDYLTENELFHGLPMEQMKELERELPMSTCEKGRLFYVPGQTGEALFLLKKGRVERYRLSPDGRKLVIDILGPGTVFGEMSIIGQGMHDKFAQALESCVLCVMSHRDVESLLSRYPTIAQHLLQIVGRRLAETEQRMSEISFMEISGRLASLLLRLHEKSGPAIEGYSHQGLADLLGTYRETVTSALNRFEAEGLIEVQRKKITILDVARLREVARAGK
jgi:CRP/FNR family transcriptional regulator, cyclic AMP receptor protein